MVQQAATRPSERFQNISHVCACWAAHGSSYGRKIQQKCGEERLSLHFEYTRVCMFQRVRTQLVTTLPSVGVPRQDSLTREMKKWKR